VPRKFPLAGHLVAAYYRALEFRMLRTSDGVVAITADFVPILEARDVAKDRIEVIENWAPLDELPLLERDNPWVRENMPDDGLRFVYSGTLGYKHNPDHLLALATAMPDAQVYVFSEGEAAESLARKAQASQTTNLSVRPWVPFSDLPAMLAGADVFVAVIEAEAGVYSVPSKILTYLAVGRPILASVPRENLAAKLLTTREAGFVAEPNDTAALIDAARALAADGTLRERLGRNGRHYATEAFEVTRIGDRFLGMIDTIVKK
jgi:glycosyltransferase involved in cell wall biosynthesis